MSIRSYITHAQLDILDVTFHDPFNALHKQHFPGGINIFQENGNRLPSLTKLLFSLFPEGFLPHRSSRVPTHQHHKRPIIKISQEIEDAPVFPRPLTLHILKTFLITSIQHALIWKTSRGGEKKKSVLLFHATGAELALNFRTHCNLSWKHFVKSQSYIVAPKYETTGPSNHTKQLCPQRKGHLPQSCFFLLLKKCQTMFYAVLMTGCCLLYHQPAIPSGRGNCLYLESIYLSDLQER